MFFLIFDILYFIGEGVTLSFFNDTVYCFQLYVPVDKNTNSTTDNKRNIQGFFLKKTKVTFVPRATQNNKNWKWICLTSSPRMQCTLYEIFMYRINT